MAKKQRDEKRPCSSLYSWYYAFGMYVLVRLARFLRYLRRELRPMYIWIRNGFGRTVGAWLHVIGGKFSVLFSALRGVFVGRETSFRRHPLAALSEIFSRFAGVVRGNPRVFGRIAAVGAPLLAAVALAVTLSYWTSATFGIEVEYDGTQLGCISDETTYHQAAELARSRVYDENGTFTISDTPKMSVTLVHAAPMLDSGELCDEILRTKGDAIAEATGLYVDGSFVASMESAAELETVLDGIKNTYCTGDEKERAEFIQTVEQVNGLFLSDSVVSAQQMQEKLTAQAVVKKEYTVQSGDTLGGIARSLDMTLSELRAMNPSLKGDTIYQGQSLTVQRPQPFLRVKVVRTVQYTEEIPFSTEKVKNDQKPVTYEKVKTAGVKGSQTVTAEITFIDGVEQSRNILAIDVTKNAVNKVVEVGTQKVTVGKTEIVIGDGVSTGVLLWPVPICRNMSRGYGRGHYGLDICNGPVTVRGKPFLAADGGTVISASNGWNGGYGNMIRIRHSNGLETVYAHCYSLSVVTGQKVTRGQVIGIIGSSGRSSGPHLHFEVWKNGKRVNPLSYVSPYN